MQVFTPGKKNWILHEAYSSDEILVSPLLSGLQIDLNDVFRIK
ncbi:hypothetical protein [Desulfoscipio geothermicus]|nr:hypothetical protein [Desulfoscipio geothermicus]